MIKYLMAVSAIPVALTMSSCNSEENNLTNTFEAPAFLRTSVPDDTRLSATVTIDGLSIYRMQFNNTFSEASIELQGLASESHLVSLVFHYLYGTQLVDIAIASRIYDPEIDNGLVAFSQTDYQDFPDDDGDGITNLVEINDGTY